MMTAEERAIVLKAVDAMLTEPNCEVVIDLLPVNRANVPDRIVISLRSPAVKLNQGLTPDGFPEEV